MTESKERIIFFNKSNNELNTALKAPKELESTAVDLLFVVDEKDVEEILKADDYSKFRDLLSSGEIDVYGLIDHTQIVDKGYMAFLNNLGLSIGEGSCCS